MASSSKDLEILGSRVSVSSDLRETMVLRTRQLKLWPGQSSIYTKLALQLLNQRQYRKAKQKFKKSIIISPNNVSRYDDWLDELYFAREFEEVILLREKYPLDKHRFPYNTENTVGICFLQLGDYDSAIERFKHAISMEKDYPLGLFNWALALYLQGKNEEAKEIFGKAKKIRSFPISLYQREVDLFKEELKREENKIFEDLIMTKIGGFEDFITMSLEEGE